MESALLEMPTRGVQFEVGTLGALDATASGETSVIKRNDENLLRQLIETLDKQLLAVLNCRNVDEFDRERRNVWDGYMRARRSLTDMMKVLVPSNLGEVLEAAVAEKVSADLARARAVLFSDAVADQFEFTGWIGGKIRYIAHAIQKAGPPQDRDADIRLNADFYLYSMWGQFHYDCVLASMKFNLPIAQEIHESILDGLRAWVNVSAIIQEALALRCAQEEPSFFESPWDEEDQELLDSSMRDLDRDAAA